MFHMTQLGPGLGSTDHLTSSNVESMEYGFVVYDNPNHVTVSSSTSVYRRPRSKFCIGLITFGIVIVITSVALGFIIHYAVNSERQVSPSSSTSNVQSHDYKAANEIKRVDFEGRIRITSLKWMPDLGNHAKQLYRVVTNHIQKELNHVFELGPLVDRYNHTVVVDLSPGSVIVDFIVVLNSRRGIDSDSLKAMIIQGLEKRSKFIKKLKSNHMPASKIVFDRKSLEIADSHNPDIKAETKYLPKPKLLTEVPQPTTTLKLPKSTTLTTVSPTTKKSKNNAKAKKNRPTTTTTLPTTTKNSLFKTEPMTTPNLQTSKTQNTTPSSTTSKTSTRKYKNKSSTTTVSITTPSRTTAKTETITDSTLVSTTHKLTTKTKTQKTKQLENPNNHTDKSEHQSGKNESFNQPKINDSSVIIRQDHHHYNYNDSQGVAHHHIHQGIQNATHEHSHSDNSSSEKPNNHYHSFNYPKHNHTQNESHIETHKQNHEHSHDKNFYHKHGGAHNLSHDETHKGFHNFSDEHQNHSSNDSQHSLHKEISSHHHVDNNSPQKVHELKHDEDNSDHARHKNVSVHHLNNQSVFWSTNEDDPKSFVNKSFNGHLTAVDDPPDRITDLNDTDAMEVPYLNSFSATDFVADGRETATVPITIEEHAPKMADLEQSDNLIPPHEPYSQNARDNKLENSIQDSRDRSKPMEYDRILTGMNRNTARGQHRESNVVDPEELAKESHPLEESFDNYWPHGNVNRPYNFPNRISTEIPVSHATPRISSNEIPQRTASTNINSLWTTPRTALDEIETGSGELSENFEKYITPPPATTSKVIPHIRDIKPSFDTSIDHHFDSSHGEDPFPNSILPRENHEDIEDSPALVPKSEKIDFSRHHREEIQEEHIEHGEMEEPLYNLHHLEYASTREPGKGDYSHSAHFHDQARDLQYDGINTTSSEEDIIPDLLANHLDQRELNKGLEPKLLHTINNDTDRVTYPLSISAAAGADFPMNTEGDEPASLHSYKKKSQSKKGHKIRKANDRGNDSIPDFIGHPVGGKASLGPSNFMPFPPAAGTASGKEGLNEENALDMDYDSNLGPSNFMPLPPQSSLPKDHKAVLPHDVIPPKVHVPKDGEGILTPPPLIHKPGIITHVLKKNKKSVNKAKEEHAHSMTHVSFKPTNKWSHPSDNELESSKKKSFQTDNPERGSKTSGNVTTNLDLTDKLKSQTKPEEHRILTNLVDSRGNDSDTLQNLSIDNENEVKQDEPLTRPSDTMVISNSTSHYSRGNLFNNVHTNSTQKFLNISNSNGELEIQPTNATSYQLDAPEVEINNTVTNTVTATETSKVTNGYNPCQDNGVVLQYLNNCRSYFLQIIRTQHNKSRCTHLLNGIMCLTDSIYDRYNVRCTDTDVEHVIKLNSQSIQQFFPSFDPNQCLN